MQIISMRAAVDAVVLTPAGVSLSPVCADVGASGPPRLHQVAHTLLHQETGQSCQTNRVPISCQVRTHRALVLFLLIKADAKRLKVSRVLPLRVGLMGNPSDGFNGKTIAMSISNFWAEVTLVESPTLVTCTFPHQNDDVCCAVQNTVLGFLQVLVPHPLNDPTAFGSLQDLFCISRKEGCVL